MLGGQLFTQPVSIFSVLPSGLVVPWDPRVISVGAGRVPTKPSPPTVRWLHTTSVAFLPARTQWIPEGPLLFLFLCLSE